MDDGGGGGIIGLVADVPGDDETADGRDDDADEGTEPPMSDDKLPFDAAALFEPPLVALA